MPTESHWFRVANPLTDHMPRFLGLEDVARVMTNDPLDGLDVSSLSILEQDELLVAEKMPLRPTSQNLRVGLTILGMTNGSLRLRNPNSPRDGLSSTRWWRRDNWRGLNTSARLKRGQRHCSYWAGQAPPKQ